MAERVDFRSGQPSTEAPMRVIAMRDTASPEVQLLSNGRYHVMLTNAGAGYSRWQDVAVTRWREDGTTDAWGSFCYLRDTETGTFWSTTPQPTEWHPDSFEAVFSEGRAEFRRRDQGIDAYTEVVVSPEDDIELRRLRLTNRSRSRRSSGSFSSVIARPFQRMRPLVGGISDIASFSVTLLPQPLSPRNPRISVLCRSKLIPFSTSFCAG